MATIFGSGFAPVTTDLTASTPLTSYQKSQVRSNIGALGMAMRPVQCVAGLNTANSLNKLTTSASNTARNSRIKVFFPYDTMLPRVRFENFLTSASDTEPAVGNAVTFSCALEMNGVAYRWTFDNSATTFTKSCADGGFIESDPLTVFVPSGTTAYIRTCAIVATTGMFIPTPIANGGATSADSYSDTIGVDSSNATGALASTINFNNLPGPASVYGITQGKSVLVQGDSIALGAADLNYGQVNGAFRTLGWVFRGANAANIPYIGQSVAGTRIAQRITPANIRQRITSFNYATDVIIQQATNDIANGDSLATVKANALTIASLHAAQGQRVWICTVVPRTSSSDGFRTATNQTPLYDAVRVPYNDWARSVPTPFTGCIDVADTVEANTSNVLTRNGGVWYVVNTAVLTSGTATAGTTTSLTDSGKTFPDLSGYYLQITGGTGSGQSKVILSNTTTVMTTLASFSPAPDATSVYQVVDIPTSDGTHPLPRYNTLMAAAVPSALISA